MAWRSCSSFLITALCTKPLCSWDFLPTFMISWHCLKLILSHASHAFKKTLRAWTHATCCLAFHRDCARLSGVPPQQQADWQTRCLFGHKFFGQIRLVSCCQDLAGIPEVPEGMGKASSLPKCWRRWQMRQLFALLRGSSKTGGRWKMGMFAADNMDLMLLTSSLCGSGLFIYPKHRLCKHFFENCSRNSGCFWCFTLCCSPCLLAGRCGQKLPLGRKGRFGSDVHQDQSLSREAAVEEMQSWGWPDSSC